MKLRAIITIIGTAAALGGTGVFLLPASASPRVVTHTLTFTAIHQASVSFSRTSGAAEDKDVKAGKVIGYDLLRFAFSPKTRHASSGVTLVTAGGFLYGVLHLTNNRVIHGTVTGGTGAFHGATGIITATPLDHNGHRTAVTIKYHT
jgi:hypothetical protein